MKRILLLMFVLSAVTISHAQSDNSSDKYNRIVLLEEFTGEGCYNCPAMASSIEQILANAEFKDYVIPVTHHSGFQPDWLTTDADIEYTWFYNDESTFAPALMFDRRPLFETSMFKKTPVGLINKTSAIKDTLRSSINLVSHITFDLNADLLNDSTVKVLVEGERNKVFSSTPERITVFIIQNRIKSVDQQGASGNYYHKHVFRKTNSTWGEPVEWKGDAFSYECSITVDPSWKKNDLKIVAFVSSYDENDPAGCSVENTRQITFPTEMTGIHDAQADKTIVRTEYFTPNGVRTSANGNGIYIVKNVFSDGTKEVKKINL